MDSPTLSCAEAIGQGGLVAILRANSAQGVAEAAHALVRGGVPALEVTLNTPEALKIIAQLRAELAGVARVGAGTILDAADARHAIEAGAEFIVTPTLQMDSIAQCKGAGVPILCGCLTPTEALAAHRAGADFIKIFPATSVGPGYIKDVLAPLPFLRLVPTGGVNLDNLAQFFQAGCAAVAIGGQLVSKAVLESGDWEALENLARHYMAAVAAARRH